MEQCASHQHHSFSQQHDICQQQQRVTDIPFTCSGCSCSCLSSEQQWCQQTLGRTQSSSRRRHKCRTASPRWSYVLLLLIAAACCSTAVDACSHHVAAAADKCKSREPTLLPESHNPATPAHSAAAAAAAPAYEEPTSIHYEEISEADLVAAVAAAAERRRKLLAYDPTAALADDESDSNLVTNSEAETAAAAAGQPPLRRCGAREVTTEERSEITLHLEHHKARKAVQQRARLSSASSAAAAAAAAVPPPPHRSSLNVPLYFHVITGKKKNSTVDAPQELLLKQLQAMNDAYGRYSIKFDLKGITRVQSESWSIAEINSPEETLMKAKLRKGGLGDLNIYVIRPASGTLGWSTFPWEAIKLGESFDGVLVHVGTMPGGNMKPYNKGYTMVHEVGHWLGLLHVFENGCDSPGDSVDDTPPQASAAYGCPIHRHSCPGSLNNDPVQNMMGYTDDSCMIGFTRGQADRVLAMWEVYRASNAQQKLSAENTLFAKGTQQGGPAQAIKQQGPHSQQQQNGVTLLEQGQLPDANLFAPTAPPGDLTGGFGGNVPGAAGYVPDKRGVTKQQRNTPAGPSKPRWSSLLTGGPLIPFNAPGAVLEANAQVKQALEQQQQHQKRKHKHKDHKGGWGSWLSITTNPPAPSTQANNGRTAAAAAAEAGALSAFQQQWQPEMGQYAAAAPAGSAVQTGVPVLQPWSQPLQQEQQQQQFQYQYAQQPPVYSQHQQQQILPPSYAGPLAPQYLIGGVGSGSDADSSQAALLAAMGGVQAYPMAAVYDGAGAGGFSVATAAMPIEQQLPESSGKHGRKASRRKSKGSRG